MYSIFFELGDILFFYIVNISMLFLTAMVWISILQRLTHMSKVWLLVYDTIGVWWKLLEVEPNGQKLGHWGLYPWRRYWDPDPSFLSFTSWLLQGEFPLLCAPALMYSPNIGLNQQANYRLKTPELLTKLNLSFLWVNYLSYFVTVMESLLTQHIYIWKFTLKSPGWRLILHGTGMGKTEFSVCLNVTTFLKCSMEVAVICNESSIIEIYFYNCTNAIYTTSA
jgi:hypothetical protein